MSTTFLDRPPAVAAVSWLYRVSFTALLTGDRLPAAVRARMDSVSPAAFAAAAAWWVLALW